MLLLLRRGCRRRRLPIPWDSHRSRLFSSSNSSNGKEVGAEERAAWLRIQKRPHHHRHQRTKPPPVLARLDGSGIDVDDAGEGGRALVGVNYDLIFGDHVLVMGGNGSGKSAFWQALIGRRSLLEAEPTTDVGGSKGIMVMSFRMHERFLETHGQRVVADVLGGASDPLARRLIVTLGLYPMWYKKLSWLSTGEVRRVLLAAVLSRAPRVVVLDKPYDGLDAPSRANLKMVLSQLCQGFPRLLVDLGLARRSIEHTSMVLITHRREEVPEDDVTRVVCMESLGIEFEGPMKEHKAEVRRRLAHTFPSPESLIQTLPRLFRPQVPRAETLSNARIRQNLSTVLEFVGVSVRRGEYVLLSQLDWRVQQGQIWAVKGLNGSGKSTTARLIMEAFEARHREQQQQQEHKGKEELEQRPTSSSPSYEGRVAVGVPHIGLVSTELHLALAQRCASWPTAQVILSGVQGYASGDYHAPAVPPKLAPMLDEWAALLGLSPTDLGKPFGRLSQGQQKLVLIARALIGAPPLVIMDEVCQGLDAKRRELVLSLLDAIGRTAGGGWLSMLYISHHADEALPAVTHVLELEKGRVVFQGTAEDCASAGRVSNNEGGAGGGGAGKGLMQGGLL